MQYGLGHLSVVPIREIAATNAPLVSQLLYGSVFKVKERRKYFSRIQLKFDGFEGWISNDQYQEITESDYNTITSIETPSYNQEFLNFVTTKQGGLIPIVMGSRLDSCSYLNHTLESDATPPKEWDKNTLVDTALLYLNSPFLEGGCTPFGIDSAGFTQMVYKVNGKALLRTIQEQATQGEALSFIEESEPGDLAFFDDTDGIINHVGIILKDNYIIHASGSVRIDRIDHTGIFNTETRKYTHSLRVIKKIA